MMAYRPNSPDAVLIDGEVAADSSETDSSEEWPDQVTNPTARRLIIAIKRYNLNTVIGILSDSVDANARIADVDGPMGASSSDGVSQDWALNVDNPPLFRYVRHRQEWYPIQYAATLATLKQKDKLLISCLTSVLLNHGADIYRVFRQPLLRRRSRSIFPGQDDFIREWTTEMEWEDDERADPNLFEENYGLRSVIHSIFEDGGFVEPFLESKSLNLESRDPQGRTVILSACRSSLGVDATTNGTLSDTRWDVNSGGYVFDTFAHDQNTIFHTLLGLGADPLAVDDRGKHVLHHLLEAYDFQKNSRPPVICKTFEFVLSRFPELINQPDKLGCYPLHAALQRLRRYIEPNYYVNAAEVDRAVDNLLDAGAKPDVLDCQKNTALHYLADDRLAETKFSDDRRRLFRKFLDLGLDINACNHEGRSPISLLFDDDGWLSSFYHSYVGIPHNQEELETEVLSMFENAGAEWTRIDSSGSNLLHILARHNTRTSVSRAKFLLLKGVDPGVKDTKGRTPKDIAKEYKSQHILEYLETLRI